MATRQALRQENSTNTLNMLTRFLQPIISSFGTVMVEFVFPIMFVKINFFDGHIVLPIQHAEVEPRSCAFDDAMS